MDRILLVFPTIDMEEAAMDYVREHFDRGESHLHGSSGLYTANSYAEWIEKTNADLDAATVTPGRVPASTYFGVRESDGRIVGIINIRHVLNDYLVNFGGHIGYGIRPTERRKGYASQMLRLALEKSKALGITRALITCDKINTASAKTIQRSGGILENEVMQENGLILQRYWIDLT